MRPPKFVIKKCLLFFAVLFASNAQAYSINMTEAGFIIRWPKSTLHFYINPVGSDNVSDGSDVAAIRQSFDEWEQIGCSKLAFNDMGDTSTKKVLANGADPNGKNELIWVEDTSWQFGQWVLGVTTPLTYNNGQIVEADIGFNGRQVTWSTSHQFGKGHIKSVAIHEIGHFFGQQHNLQYNQNDPPTMAPSVDPYGKSGSLHQDDLLAPCFLYPAGNQGFTCNNDSECPYVVDRNSNDQEFYSAKLVCQNSKCVFGTGGGGTQKTLGEACTSEQDCAGSLFCQPLGDGTAYCSQLCTPAQADCPGGFDCAPYQSGNGGACIPTGDQPLKPVGEFCNAHSECQSGVCYPNGSGTWQCRTSCDNDTQCDGSEGCFHAPGFPKGACLPTSDIPVSKVPNGDPCNSDDDCDSAICVPNIGTAGPFLCRSACDLMVGCGGGFVCVDVHPTAGPSCMPESSVPTLDNGAACATDGECSSEICDAGTCVPSCNIISPNCATGQVCQRREKDGVSGSCVPPGPIGLGQSCGGDAACASRFCEGLSGGDGMLCLTPCLPGGDGECGDTRVCSTLAELEVLGACFEKNGDVPTEPVVTDGGGADGGGTTTGDLVVPRAPTTCTASPVGSGGPMSILLLAMACLFVIRRRNA